VVARAKVSTGGDAGGAHTPAATGGGETQARTPKRPKRPKPEPVVRNETPEPKEEPAATNPDLGRKTEEPAPKEPTDTSPAEPEPKPEKGPKGKFASHYYFGNASSSLTSQSKAKLKATARYLVANPDKSVVIEGHASTNGNHAANQSLSEVRANAVKDQLVSLGVEESRISVEAFGSERPEFKPGASAKNRRVVIVLK
jgi:outer membrane protein OmpA-like peptidoglycan-associated protein